MTVGTNSPFGLRPISSIVGGAWDGKTNDYSIFASADGTTTDTVSLFIGDPVRVEPTQADYVGAGVNLNSKKNLITQYRNLTINAGVTDFPDEPVVGVFNGCIYQSTQSMVNNTVYYPTWPGATHVVPGTTPIAQIIDDPMVEFEIQISAFNNANANAFVASPIFPIAKGNGLDTVFGGMGSNFGMAHGGGTNFNTVQDAWTEVTGNTYANNPTTGNAITHRSAFYLCSSTRTDIAGTNEYVKTDDKLPLKLIGYSDSVEDISAYNLTFGQPTPLTLNTTPFLVMKVKINNHLYSRGTVGVTTG